MDKGHVGWMPKGDDGGNPRIGRCPCSIVPLGVGFRSNTLLTLGSSVKPSAYLTCTMQAYLVLLLAAYREYVERTMTFAWLSPSNPSAPASQRPSVPSGPSALASVVAAFPCRYQWLLSADRTAPAQLEVPPRQRCVPVQALSAIGT